MKIETDALCPICLKTIPATKIKKGQDIFLERTCPEHGYFSDKIAKDAKRFLDKTFDVVGKEFNPVTTFSGECGRDCGWCDKHRQHICTGLIEITESCNMACPICYFGQKSSKHISIDEFKNRLETLLTVENGSLDVLQISGGECLIHPDFLEMLDIALEKNIGRVLINTNGLALLENEVIFSKIRDNKDKVEIYLQFDGFDDEVYKTLRGCSLVQQKIDIINKFPQRIAKVLHELIDPNNCDLSYIALDKKMGKSHEYSTRLFAELRSVYNGKTTNKKYTKEMLEELYKYLIIR